MRLERQRGYTLLEVMISSVILVSMILVVTSLSKSGSDAERYASRLTRATEIGQGVIDEIRRGLSSSVRVFHDDTVGNAYANMLELPASAPRITSRLPVLRPSGIFQREATGQRLSGNQLLFARHAWTDTYTASSGRSFNLDVYRVHCYYARVDGGGLVAGSSTGLNFARFISEPLADGKQVNAIADPTDRSDVLLLLAAGRTMALQPPAHAPLQVVWNMGEDPSIAGTLRQIDGSGNLVNNPLPPRNATWRLQVDSQRSSTGLLYYRHYSLATNWAPPAYGVGAFSQVDNTAPGFPHGFELQLIGPASARQLLVRLCVVSTNRAGHRAYARLEVIQDCRDI